MDYFNSYQKEFYCVNKASDIGLPISKVYFVGTEGDFSYIILNYIDGINGSDLPKERFPEIYRTLGNYAHKLNSIEVNGFGRDVKDEHSGFFKDWNTFYSEKIENIFDDNVFVDKSVLNAEQVKVIKSRLSEIKNYQVKPHLCHGNLHITNTVVSDNGDVYLIDWGNGVGHFTPHVDLADLIAWKDRMYLDDFLEGYGMSKEDFEKIEHDVNTLLIIQLLNVIKYSFKIDKKFNDEDFIKNSVTRIMELK